MKLNISLCSYKNKDFDLIFEADDGKTLVISGNRDFTSEEHDFIWKYFPPCVMTEYEAKE